MNLAENIKLLQGIAELNGFNRVLIERSSGVVRNALHFLGSLGINPESALAYRVRIGAAGFFQVDRR